MKWTICGFSQEKMIEYNMDAIDAIMLRWFIDFKDSGTMRTIHEKGKAYYWIEYEYLLKELPIINIKSKDVLRRRLKKMEQNKILNYFTHKKGGVYSFYTIGENYINLISKQENDPTQKSIPQKKNTGYLLKNEFNPTQKSEGSYSKVGTNIHLLDSSTNINKNNKDQKNFDPILKSDDLGNEKKEKSKDLPKDKINLFFEKLWKLYPNKRGKSKINNANKKALFDISFDKLELCINRYKNDPELENNGGFKKYMHGSTFFKNGYKEFLDENYDEEIYKEKQYKKNLNTNKPEQMTNYNQRTFEEAIGDDFLYDNDCFKNEENEKSNENEKKEVIQDGHEKTEHT